jgi:hypothetical protein
MRRSASEIINELELRIAYLEKQSASASLCLIYTTGMSGAEFNVPWEGRNELKKAVEASLGKHNYLEKSSFKEIGNVGSGSGNIHTYKLTIKRGDIDKVITDVKKKMKCVVG